MSERIPIVAAIDTEALIWGVRQKGQRDKLERGKWLFEELEDINARIIVPAVVVAEYLVRVDLLRREAVITELSRRFIIPSFDVKWRRLRLGFISSATPSDRGAPRTGASASRRIVLLFPPPIHTRRSGSIVTTKTVVSSPKL